MTPIVRLLGADHTHCDELFAEAENAVAGRDWTAAERLFADFRQALARHIAAEEETLFPALEARTGMTAGPTRVMRSEHAQMNDLVERMGTAVARRDDAAYLGLSETLLMLMRQHNMKEEQILYPMCDRALEDNDGLVAAMERVIHPA